MLKRPITYTDFEDNVVTDIYYFHVSKSELIETEMSTEGGLADTLKRIVETKDKPGLIAEFKRLILWAYGEKSADGKSFVKNEELRTKFSQTAAYDALFFDLATNEKSALDFINGILPSEMRGDFEKAMLMQQTPSPLPPPTDSASTSSV